MKKIALISSFIAVAIAAASCGRQVYKSADAIPVNYLSVERVVNSAEFLPAPPDSASAVWLHDVERYQWGKTMRGTPRGYQAVKDAYISGAGLADAFSEAFGMEISFEKTPAIYTLIRHMCEDAGSLSTKLAKERYFRPRPYMVFGEPTSIPEAEDALRNNGSYPSGHSAMGFAVALVLSEVNPGRAAQIMQRGYDIGESRVIAGYHFDSDVRMGRLCASMVVPVLHSDARFMRDLEAAKREFAKLWPKATPDAASAVLDKYSGDENVRHVAIVRCKGGSDAEVAIYGRDSIIPGWKFICGADAFIGRNGFTADKREGDGMTPVGDFGVLSAFGILPAPGECAFPYVNVDEHIYAVDTDNEFYNKIVDTRKEGPRQGEHMIEYAPEYNYGLALDYNKECVPGLGSNIFFHCKGAKPFTGGCVAVDESLMKGIVSCFGPADRVVILPE